MANNYNPGSVVEMGSSANHEIPRSMDNNYNPGSVLLEPGSSAQPNSMMNNPGSEYRPSPLD